MNHPDPHDDDLPPPDASGERPATRLPQHPSQDVADDTEAAPAPLAPSRQGPQAEDAKLPASREVD